MYILRSMWCSVFLLFIIKLYYQVHYVSMVLCCHVVYMARGFVQILLMQRLFMIFLLSRT
jgi:hypothetical protein